MGMILSCKRIEAREALDLGLVNEVTTPEDLLPAARRWAAEILKAAPLAIAASKQAVMRGLDEPSLAAAIRGLESYPAFVRWRGAEDTREGPRAFAEKRPPAWKGR
jgi:crotonobetainyl-CoA hydratase